MTRASSVFPTPVGPRKTKVPIGRRGSRSPARLRRIALAIAVTASSWPTMKRASSSSIRTSLSDSRSSSLVTGIFVMFERTSAMSSALTSARRTFLFSFHSFFRR